MQIHTLYLRNDICCDTYIEVGELCAALEVSVERIERNNGDYVVTAGDWRLVVPADNVAGYDYHVSKSKPATQEESVA